MMVDIESAVRFFLSTLPDLTQIFGTRIFTGRNLPAGYKPGNGAALLLMVRGGDQDFSSRVLMPSIQFRIYAETEKEARQASQALYKGINDQKNRQIIFSRMESGTLPVLLSEPGTDWPYVLTFFKFHIQNE